jgi:hypothetical protein
MPHKRGQIRVKRKGSGHQKVFIESGDETLGYTAMTLHWVRKIDTDTSDPGDPFTFDLNAPLVFPNGSPFTVIDIKAKKVTVAYAGAPPPDQAWSCQINVVDGKKAKPGGILSDGSATIKNH